MLKNSFSLKLMLLPAIGLDRVSVATTGEAETILLCWFLNSAFTFSSRLAFL
jgi:hypothetical protein